MGMLPGAARPGSPRCSCVAVAGLALCIAARAHAEEICGKGPEPWVAVLFAEGNWRPETAQAILLDLRAGLSNRGIEACSAGSQGAQPAAAAIRLSATSSDAVHVTVNVHDAVTKKELSRDVDLSRVPSDGRTFAIALAADELLWASWAEIALHRPRRTIVASPTLVAEVARSIEPAATRQRPLARLGIQLSEEHYARGLTQLGPDVAFSFNWSPRLVSRLFAGYRQGLDVTSNHGRIASSALVASLDLGASLLQTRRFELTIAFGGASAWCHFEGKSDAGSVTATFNGLAVYAHGNLLAALRVQGPLWLQLAVGGGLALRGLEATDTGQVAVGMAGFRQSAFVAFMGEL